MLSHNEGRNNDTSTSFKWHALTYVKSRRCSPARIFSRIARSLGCSIRSPSDGFGTEPPRDLRMVGSATFPHDRPRHSCDFRSAFFGGSASNNECQSVGCESTTSRHRRQTCERVTGRHARSNTIRRNSTSIPAIRDLVWASRWEGKATSSRRVLRALRHHRGGRMRVNTCVVRRMIC